MRKLFMFGCLLLVLGKTGYCDGIGDQINATLLSHVETITQFAADGTTRIGLLDNVFQIGKIGDSYIGAARFGYKGIANSDGSFGRGGYEAGVFIHLNPIVKDVITLNPQWDFLNALEYGPSYNYDFSQHQGFVSFDIGLAFGLNPLK